MTAGETDDPEANLPKAINSLPIRIGLFYVGSMIAVMSVYPWDQITTTASPFVQVFSGIGIVGAAGILNFVVLTAAVSATNSCLFSTSRTMYALSMGGNASSFLTKLGRNGVPNIALNFSTAFLLIIVVLNYFIPAGVFSLVSSVSTINFVVVWVVLLIVHIKYRRVHPKGTKIFKMPGYPLTDYVTLIFFVFILGFLLVNKSTRVAMIISLISIGSMLVIYQLSIHRGKVK